jgi:translation initiation factor eIF-2B subunit epsilon
MGKKDDKKASDDGNMKADQPLQAILLADSFEKNFRPITLEKPKVLLPLVNTPMLEYTLEFLSQNEVGEVRNQAMRSSH